MKLAQVWPVALLLFSLTSCAPKVPKDPGPYLEAKAAFMAGSLEEAKTKLLSLTKSYPEFFQANLLLGKTFFFIGDNEKALKYFEKSRSLEKSSLEARLYCARTLIALSQKEKAEKILNGILAVESDCPDALFMLARMKTAEGDTAQAIALYRRGLLYTQSLSMARYDLAKIYEQNSQIELAKAEIVKAIYLNESPDDPAVLAMLEIHKRLSGVPDENE